jgi:CheY-like chemotaxis protein
MKSIRKSDLKGAGDTLSIEKESDEKAESAWDQVRLDGVKILLIEDTQDARVYISRIFSRAGAQVLAASSAQEARQILTHDEPDVIVSDIAMPDEDGLSFMRKLRAEEAWSGSQIPAMALTAFTDTQMRNQIFKAGFQAHVAKCSNFESILQTVYELTNGQSSGTLH